LRLGGQTGTLGLVSLLRRRSFAQTDIGKKRKHNEDAFRCSDELGLYVVADGVGGHAKGEVASVEAVEQIHNFVAQGREAVAAATLADPASQRPVKRLLESAVQSACYMVFGMAEVEPSHQGMSTTISALLVLKDYAVTAQVGDSRIYRIRDGAGAQLTEDHTLVNHKLKQGLITREEARTMKGKNVITRAVGHREYVEVDVREVDVGAGDRFLLCSDGLHGYLDDGELERVLESAPPDQAPAAFVKLANDRGGKDNITVVLVFLDPTAETSDRRTVVGF
jgi:protein phosphatase